MELGYGKRNVTCALKILEAGFCKVLASKFIISATKIRKIFTNMKIIDLSGVTIQIPKGYYYRQFEDLLTEKAEAYRHSTIAKARSDPYIFFIYLWSGARDNLRTGGRPRSHA